MIRKSFKYLGLSLVLVTPGFGANALTVDELVTKYSAGFDTDGSGKALAVPGFARDVPAAERAEVMAKILDYLVSADPINANAISGACRVLMDLNIPWNNHLRKSVYSLATCSNWTARACASSVLAKRQKDSARDIILSFQRDSDDRVRASSLADIQGWTDAESIYQKYINAHDGDPNFASSVQAAMDSLALNRRILGRKNHP